MECFAFFEDQDEGDKNENSSTCGKVGKTRAPYQGSGNRSTAYLVEQDVMKKAVTISFRHCAGFTAFLARRRNILATGPNVSDSRYGPATGNKSTDHANFSVENKTIPK